jgi:hopanoid biosynthesis associated RND transporter like protein HpnN
VTKNPEPVCTEATRPASRWLVWLVSTVLRAPALVLVLALLLVGLSVWGAFTQLQYQTSRNDLISPHKDYQQRWNNYLAEFGEDDDMVVVVQGHDGAAMRAALEAVAAGIQKQPDRFDRLFYKVDLRHLRSRALLYLDEAEIANIQTNLGDMDLLLTVGPLAWRGIGLNNLLHEAVNRLDRVGLAKPLTAADKQLLGQLLAVCRAARATLTNPASYKNPWGSMIARQDPRSAAGHGSSEQQQQDQLAEPQYFFNGDSSLAFLLVRPVKEAGSFTASLRSVESLRAILAEVRSQHPQLQLGLTGLPVLETDEMAAADRDTQRAGILALSGVCILFLLVYRGLCYPVLTVVTLLVGTAWAVGWAVVTIGHLNILSATFAVMLIGMGDYGVLWVMRYEQARLQGADVRTSLLHTTTHVAIGNLTAAGTLALAFFAAILADFKAVAELGFIAGCGVLLCALACFTVLPAVLILFDRRCPASAESPTTLPLRRHWLTASLGGMLAGLVGEGTPVSAAPTPGDPRTTIDPEKAAEQSWLPALAARPRWVLVGSLLVILALGYAATAIRYDHNLLHLQASDLESVRWEMLLVEKTAGASWHALSYTRSPEEALSLKARYEQLPEVSRVVEVASLLPRDQEAKLPRLRAIQGKLGWLPGRGDRIPHALPEVPMIRQDLARLRELTLLRMVDDPLLAQLLDAVSRLDETIAALPDLSQVARSFQWFDERISRDLADNLHQLREVSTPTPITLDDFPPSLRERHVGKSGTWLLRIFARDCLWEFEPLEHFCRQVRTVDASATGKVFGTVEGLKAMKSGLERAGLYAFLVIALVLWLDFRSVKRTLVAILPLVLGVVCSVGLLALIGLPLNPANMIAFPLILGVGVDNGVHVLHDFWIRRRKNTTEPGGGVTISHAIGRGVLVKALTTMIGFAALMISSQRGLQGLGLILTLGVACSMVASLLVLPALLVEWSRWRPLPTPGIEAPDRQAA